MDEKNNLTEQIVLLTLYFITWQAATADVRLFRFALTTIVAFVAGIVFIRFADLFLSNQLKDSVGVFRRNALLFLFSLFGLAVVGINFMPELNQFREHYYYLLILMVGLMMVKVLIEYKIIGRFDVRTSKSVVKNEQYG